MMGGLAHGQGHTLCLWQQRLNHTPSPNLRGACPTRMKYAKCTLYISKKIKKAEKKMNKNQCELRQEEKKIKPESG